MNVELEYRARTDALSPAQRIRRAEALFNWSRAYLVRSIRAEHGKLSDDDLRWELALRQYGSDAATRELIGRLRGRASR